METSLGRLQTQNDKLIKENIKLKDKIDELKEENKQFKRKIKKIEEEINDKIEKEVRKALEKFESKEIKRLTEENTQLRERVFKLEQMLNISSENSSLPPSQNPIWHKDTKVYDSRSQKKKLRKSVDKLDINNINLKNLMIMKSQKLKNINLILVQNVVVKI